MVKPGNYVSNAVLKCCWKTILWQKKNFFLGKSYLSENVMSPKSEQVYVLKYIMENIVKITLAFQKAFLMGNVNVVTSWNRTLLFPGSQVDKMQPWEFFWLSTFTEWTSNVIHFADRNIWINTCRINLVLASRCTQWQWMSQNEVNPLSTYSIRVDHQMHKDINPILQHSEHSY